MSSGLLFRDPEALKHLECSNCQKLLNDPVQPSCGHHLCKCCADEIIQKFCPPYCCHEDCGEEFAIEDGVYYFPDRFVKREIQALKVQCRVCNWEGNFDGSHFKDCKESCPFCGEKMSRHDLDRHTESCEKFLSNFKHGLKYTPRKINDEKYTSSYEEEYTSDFEQKLNYAQQVTDEVKDTFLAKFEHLSDMIKRVQMSVSILNTQIFGLQKRIQSISAAVENRNIRVSLFENSNQDGSMIWKIPQFSQHISDAEKGQYTSRFSLPFYSGKYGYKMCLCLYIMGNGIGKGTHLSLFFVVMRGEFDNILQWPFTHKVTFKLINQAGGKDIVHTFQPDPTSCSFQKPKSDMNVASGCPRFVSHMEVESSGFKVDDTLFIKCMVDTSTIHHP